MAQFLNTTEINLYLEKIIKEAEHKLLLMSPYLKISQRIRQLIEDKRRDAIDFRIVYGKSELSTQEMEWIQELGYIQLFFCENLHAKCYINEKYCLITSMNLYDFSQANNTEMGILIPKQGNNNFLAKDNDAEVYQQVYEEVRRIVRVSERVTTFAKGSSQTKPSRASTRKPKEKVEHTNGTYRQVLASKGSPKHEKLTTAKLAKEMGISNRSFKERLIQEGYIAMRDGKHYITDKGKQKGGELRVGRYGPYSLWPRNFTFSN